MDPFTSHLAVDFPLSAGVRGLTLVMALLLMVRTALDPDTKGRRARWAFAGSLALGATSCGLTALDSAVHRGAAPSTAANVIGACAFLLAGLGLRHLPRSYDIRAGRQRLVLDAVIAGSSLLFCAWLFVIKPVLHTHMSVSSAFVLVGYPVGDAVIAAVVLAFASHARREDRPILARAGVGVLLLGVGQSATSHTLATGHPATFGWADVIFEAGMVLLVTSALRTGTGLGARWWHHGFPRLDLPLVAAASTVTFGMPYVALGHDLGLLDVTPAAVMIIALLVRQRLDTHELVAIAAVHEHAASVDELTGLATRRAFLARLEKHLEGSHVDTVAVALIDLDGFKEINDSFGHQTGDDVLVGFSQILRRHAGDAVAARLGGDEFVVACSTVDAPERVREIAEHVGRVHRVQVDGHRTLAVGCSIGIAVSAPGDSRTADVMRRADLAMYAAKATPASSVAMFEQSMQDAASRKKLLAAELAGVTDRDELHLVYQPLHRLEDGELIAAETLLRWTHPTFGAVSPAEFIPLAEETGHIATIGDWVLAGALAAMRELEKAGRHVPRLLVNVSSYQIDDTAFPDRVEQLLATYGIQPERLTLEITETALAGLAATDVLRALHESGVRLAIDDFGTGYSNLARLSHLPVDILKIDREFISSVETQAGRDVLNAVVALAATLGMTTVAEGIETPCQLDIARECGITWGQGYLLGRPAPVAALGARLPAPRKETVLL